ncbi:MAG: AAA family ATPase [Candidatus Eisenbacteria bacterium]|nr:AAA family ATPase [Candidatus Eisenbacteria bacterium]
MAMTALSNLLASGSNVVFDAANADPAARRKHLEIAASTGRSVTAGYFDTSFRTWAERNAGRPRPVAVYALIRFARHLGSPRPRKCDRRRVIL